MALSLRREGARVGYDSRTLRPATRRNTTLVDGALLLILLLGVMYAVVILPRQRQMQRHRRLVGSLTAGDDIVTIGGLHGTISAVEGEDLLLELAPGVEVRLARDAVAARAGEPSEVDADDELAEDGETDEPEG